MKKKIIMIAICLVLGLSGIFYAFAANNALQEEQLQSQQIEAIETQTEAKLENVLAQRDMETILRNNGLYEDEVRKNMTKYLETIALYQMPQEHINLFLDRAEQGQDLDKLLDIYRFLFVTNKNYSLIDEIYSEGKNSNFKRNNWLEEAFNKKTNYAGGVLNENEIQAYFEEGLNAGDIQLANALCFKGVKTIKQILDERVSGNSWFTIISAIYPEAGLNASKFGKEEGRVIFEHIKTGMLNQESANVSYDKNAEENQKVSVFAQNKISARAGTAHTVLEEKNLQFVLDEDMLSYAKQKLPSMPEEEIKKNIEEKGYLIREIERGLAIAENEGISLDEAIRFDLNEGGI